VSLKALSEVIIKAHSAVPRNLLTQLQDRCACLLQALIADDSQRELPDKFRDAVVQTEL
jgi:hypothetical protein